MIPVKYMVRRLIWYFLSMLAVLTIIFIIPRLSPVSPITRFIASLEVEGMLTGETRQLIEEYKKLFGLDADLFTQYVRYISSVLRGYLGPSYAYFPTPVSALIARHLPWTIGLLSTTVIISWVIGNLLGAIVGWRKGSKVSSFLAGICLIISRIPYYILAIIVVLVFGVYIPILPPGGGWTTGRIPSLSLSFILDVIHHSILPAFSIIAVSLGGWLISMRSLTVSIRGEDYLLFAEAKGLKRNKIMMKYAFRNALLPQVTGLAVSLGRIMSGALLTEVIFAYPGIGYLFVGALAFNDYNLIQGIVLIICLSVLTSILLIDFLYPLIDPRVRYERR